MIKLLLSKLILFKYYSNLKFYSYSSQYFDLKNKFSTVMGRFKNIINSDKFKNYIIRIINRLVLFIIFHIGNYKHICRLI